MLSTGSGSKLLIKWNELFLLGINWNVPSSVWIAKLNQVMHLFCANKSSLLYEFSRVPSNATNLWIAVHKVCSKSDHLLYAKPLYASSFSKKALRYNSCTFYMVLSLSIIPLPWKYWWVFECVSSCAFSFHLSWTFCHSFDKAVVCHQFHHEPLHVCFNLLFLWFWTDKICIQLFCVL